ncbi:MAG TPA: S8 family serine peptidase [Verrucomicrobiae bacterium]|nr:S8 family serine peptidase [Verrucomicrobiae bacterium]
MLRPVTPHRTARFRFIVPVLLACILSAYSKPIKLRSGQIEPRGESARGHGPTQPRGDADLYLIQLKDNPPRDWRGEIKALGVQVLRYVPEDSFIARIPAGSVARIGMLQFVEWVGEYLPEHKVHPKLARALALPGVQSHNVSILLSRQATGNQRNSSRAAFISVRQESTLPFGHILRGNVSSAKLAELTRSSAVLWIEPGPNFKLVDETAAKIVAGDGGPAQTFAQSFGFDGTGVTVAVPDSGLNNGDAASMHPDLFGRVPTFFYYGTLTDAADEHSHGTHVAGIIAGNGATGEVDEYGALYGLGVAPQARIIPQRIFDGIGNYEAPPSFERLTRDAVRAGADIGSNSWGDDTQGRYDLSAAEFDALVRDADALAPGAQQFILEFSAGNAGPGEQTIGSPAVAKNVIATGASQNDRFDFIIYAEGQDAMADFSSRGPCEDGRIKPDVVAPGTWIASLKSASAGTENAWAEISENYIYQGGTSQAGPQVSGAAAVLVQYLRDIYGIVRPAPALVKAALIHSAIDMDDSFGTAPAPNPDEGWGRVDLTQIILAPTPFEFVNQTQLLIQNQTYERHIVCSSDVVPLHVTMAYTDYPGFAGAIPAIVNDLDLEVTAPDGTVYHGNQFFNGESIPNSPARDNINNVEVVYLANPLPGEYILRVQARRVVEDSLVETAALDQDFALVISADIPAPGTGLVLFDRPAYTAPSTIKVQVIDSDLAGQSTVNVQVRSTTDSAGRTIQLRAANPSGSFTGSVATVRAGVLTGGLQIAHNDTIEATYQDAQTGPKTVTARGDLVAPVLSNVTTTNAFGRMLVRWQSDEPSDSIVRYGTNSSLTLGATNAILTSTHEVELDDLISGRTYFYLVISTDEAGNRTTNNNNGALFSFVAVSAAPVLLVDAYREDPDSTPIPRTVYTDPLNAIGIPYEVWDVASRGSPTLANLRPFQVVMWRITDSFYLSDASLSPAEQNAIQSYINGGGSFFMSSMEILSRLGDVPFRRNVFQVQQFLPNSDPFGGPCTDCDEDFGVPTIRAPANEPVTRGVLANLDYSDYPFFDLGFSQIGPDLSDTFTLTTNAAPIFLEDGSSKPCGMKFPRPGRDAPGRVVFLSFPLDTIPATGPAPNNRTAVLRGVLQFLAPGYGGFATIAMDRSEYTLPDVITIELADSDLAGAGQATVNAYSDAFTTRVPVTLVESPRAGLFRGTVTVVRGSEPAGPGKVRANSGGTVFVEYVDGTQTVQASAIIDTIPPQITNLYLEPDYESALVWWDTSELADAMVAYGESRLLGRTEYDGEMSDYHELRLSGLLPNRTYYYKVVSRDLAGNVVEDDNNGQLYTFQTLAPIIPPWFDDLETGGTDWTVESTDDSESSWTLGIPSNPWDGHAWASNLGEGPLDYAETVLGSPALDLRGGNEATLRFVHRYDFTERSEFDLIEGGQLVIVTNPVTAPVILAEYSDSTDWEEEIIDLTPYVGRVVFIGWYYQLLSFDFVSRPGWVVDDVSVTLTTVTPGAIRITNNLVQARFSLTGRGTTRNGEGLNTLFTNLPPGDYTVAWTDVPYYNTPVGQTHSLGSGDSWVTGGSYTFPDSNNNGMSDIWETNFFGGVAPDRSRATDTDHDGSTDYDEFNAGTNPNSASSYLRFVQPSIMPGNVLRLQWTSVPGRSYRVQSSTDARSWSAVTDWIQASSVNTSITVPMGSALLFRVAVQP